MAITDKWEFKYEPKTIDEMVLNPDVRTRLSKSLEELPNVMLIGTPGIGKGTWVNILKNQYPDAAIRKINGSDDNGIGVFREIIKPFCSTPPLDDSLNIMYINEAERLTSATKDAMLDFMESVQNITRFVLCVNYTHTFLDEFKSRFRMIEMLPPSGRDVYFHLEKILINEKIQYNKSSLTKIVKKCYPDIRKAIITVQENISNNRLSDNLIITTLDDIHKEVYKEMLTRDADNVRKVLRSNAIDYVSLYKYLYTLIMDAKEDGVFVKEADAILLIAEHLQNDSTSAIKEINFMHMFFKMRKQGVL